MYKGEKMLPYKLKNGDTIGVVSSSEPITEDRIIDIERSLLIAKLDESK